MSMRLRAVRSCAAALLVVSAFAAPITAQSQSIGERASAVSLSQIRIENFGQVNPNYYRGGQPHDRDYQDLASLGVKTLINLTSDDADAREKALTERAGMKYFQIPMTTHEQPSAAQLDQFLKLVTDPANQPVFVHCVGGRHRTGVMTAAYRMTRDGWSADQAFAEMKRYKFGMDILHPEFKEFVYGYQAPANAAVSAAATSAAPKTRN